MKRMEARENWTLFRSNEVSDLHDLYGREFDQKYKEYELKAENGEIWSHSMPAIDLWKQMLKMIFRNRSPLDNIQKIPVMFEVPKIMLA